MLEVIRAADGSISPGPLQFGTGFASLFCPSARKHGDHPFVDQRNNQTIYARGYKESITVSLTGQNPGGAAPFMWRRIVFMYKGLDLIRGAVDGTAWNYPYYDASSTPNSDMRRVWNAPTSPQYINLRDVLFRGREGTDWNNVLTAKVDTKSVTVTYDKTVSLNSGNTAGSVRIFKRWHPLNKNVTYFDDEDGNGMDVNYLSSRTNNGAGDMYIFDYITNLGSPNPTTCTISAEGTFYWHER